MPGLAEVSRNGMSSWAYCACGVAMVAVHQVALRSISRPNLNTPCRHRYASTCKPNQPSQRIGFPTARPIAGIQRREVKQGHTVHHETSQMVRRQTVAQHTSDAIAWL